MDEIFADTIVYDVGDFGMGELYGIDAIEHASLTLGDINPLGHHMTNVVITGIDSDVA